jgi:hypothetical protein
MELNPESRAAYLQLQTLKYDEAANLFLRANQTPALRLLNDQELSASIKWMTSMIVTITGVKLLKGDAQAMMRLMKRMLPEHYGKLTTEEIVYAFELNAMSKLNNGEHISHFNSFTMDYIGKVLNAYVEYRKIFASTIQDVYYTEKQKLLLPVTEDHTHDDEDFFNQCVAEYIMTKNVILSGVLFDTLVRMGKIERDAFKKFISRAKHQMIGQSAKEQIKKSDMTAISIGARISQLKIGEPKDEIESIARKLCVHEFISATIKTNKND